MVVLRWLVAVVASTAAAVVTAAVMLTLTTIPTAAVASTADRLYRDRALVEQGHHGALEVRSCQPPGVPPGRTQKPDRWACTGRFFSDDGTVAIDKLSAYPAEQPGELIQGWVRNASTPELATHPVVVPEAVTGLIVVLAFLIFSFGLLMTAWVVVLATRFAWRIRGRRAGIRRSPSRPGPSTAQGTVISPPTSGP